MDNKFYVSYEAARLLKEKGYKRHVNQYYDENGFLHDLAYDENYDYQMSNNDLDLDHYAAPTKAEAIDWLESKGIVVEVVFDCNIQRWHFSIYKEEKAPWIKHLSNDTFQTRLEAEEAAIIKALELL